jgi:uncharacterized protein YigE (DUF2233 family)
MTNLRLVCILMLFMCAISSRCQKWTNVAPGLELMRNGILDDQGHITKFTLVRCDLTKHAVKIVDTSGEISKERAFPEFSLNEVMNKTGAAIVSNAGSTTSFTLPQPAGLLQVNGRVLSLLATKSSQFNGVLCISRVQGATKTRISILQFSEWNRAQCTDAVQRGPILTADPHSIEDLGTVRSERTVAAVDSDHRLLLLVTNGKASLSAIASFLYSRSANLGIQFALNLDGSSSSGLLLRDISKGRPSETLAGNIDVLVASAILIY